MSIAFATTIPAEMAAQEPFGLLQIVQQVCLRRLLANPLAKETWGIVVIDWLLHGADEMDFLAWLLRRSRGAFVMTKA